MLEGPTITRAARIGVIGVLMLGAPLAGRAQVTFTGQTSGTFFVNGTPTTLAGLTFTGAAFTGTTFNDRVGFSNLGSFSVAPNFAVPAGTTFQLNFLFSSPPGSTLDEPVVATLTGQVIVGPAGLVEILFVNETTGGTIIGNSFQLAVNDVDLGSAQTAMVTGSITTAAEPATMALLATGLAGLGAVRRRRRRSSGVV